MKIIPIIIVAVSSLLGSFGQLAFKIGANKLEMNIKKILTNYMLSLGVILYGISAIGFIYALRLDELTVLYPVVATSYIWTTLLANKFLNERINRYKWIGIALIIIGVIVIVQ